MKLQFAFGNPRGKKRKSVAKRRKSRKTNSVKAKLRKGSSMAKKKRHVKRRSKHRRHKRRNPEAALIRKGGRTVGREFSPLNKRESDAAEGIFKSLLIKYKAAPLGAGKSALLREMAGLKKKLNKRSSYLKTLARYEEEADVKISKFELGKKKKGAKVAKRKKKKGGKKKVRRSKKAKAAAPKRAKRRKGGKRKSSKRRKHKKVAKVSAAPKKRRHKRRKGGKRKGSKRRSRRRVKMISHKHGSNVRHIKKGTSFRFKSKSKRGKRSITVSGRVRVNPYRRNPSMADQVKTYTGMSQEELGALALGAALVPIINGGIAKVPGGAALVTAINGVVGAQAVGSVIPLGIGIALNAVAEHAVKSGQGNKYLKMTGEGLVAAGLIGLVMGIAQKYVNPMLGLSGINFTPSMRGINFTPNMGIMPQLNGGLGIMPQLNGMGAPGDYGGNAGYRQSSADFGRVGNYGDFGADSSMDSDYDTDAIDGDEHTTAMN